MPNLTNIFSYLTVSLHLHHAFPPIAIDELLLLSKATCEVELIFPHLLKFIILAFLLLSYIISFSFLIDYSHQNINIEKVFICQIMEAKYCLIYFKNLMYQQKCNLHNKVYKENRNHIMKGKFLLVSQLTLLHFISFFLTYFILKIMYSARIA